MTIADRKRQLEIDIQVLRLCEAVELQLGDYDNKYNQEVWDEALKLYRLVKNNE